MGMVSVNWISITIKAMSDVIADAMVVKKARIAGEDGVMETKESNKCRVPVFRPFAGQC